MTNIHGNGMAAAKALIVTAVINSLFATGYGQEAAVEEPPPSDQSAGRDVAERFLRVGPFDIRPSVRAGVMYDDNIYIQPEGDEDDDVVFNITPGALLGAGDYQEKEFSYLRLFYAPTVLLFTDNTDENTVDHDAKLGVMLAENRWKLSLDQAFVKESGAVIDVGDRIDRRLYDTRLGFLYELSPKTSLDVSGRQRINDYDRRADFNEWNAGLGADYAVTPKVKAGAGVVLGWLDVEDSVNQTYQQFLARASYSLTEKVEALGSLGGELRQFQGDQDGRGSFVYSIGVNYHPFVNTTLNLETYRRNQNSVVEADQNYTTTGFSIGARQLFRENYAVYLSGGYENSDYEANADTVNADREDDYYLIRGGFDWAVLEKMVVGVFYQYRRNRSSADFGLYDFNNHQVGLTMAYEF